MIFFLCNRHLKYCSVTYMWLVTTPRVMVLLRHFVYSLYRYYVQHSISSQVYSNIFKWLIITLLAFFL